MVSERYGKGIGVLHRQRRIQAPTLLLCVALIGSAVLVLALQWNLTFFADSWTVLLYRQGTSLGDFFQPANEHLIALSVVVTKLCVGIFGMATPRAEAVVMVLTFLGSAVLLFIYVRRRTSAWLALMAATLVLFLGSAWGVLLWTTEIQFSGAMLAALGMLLMLEREDSRGDAWACVLLTISIGFGSLGLAFAAAAFVDVLQRRTERGLRRSYVFALPLLFYVLWYAGWGHTAVHHLTLHNVLYSPHYVVDGLAASVGYLLGLSTPSGWTVAQPDWGRPLFVTLAAIAVIVLWRRPKISQRLWPAAAAALSFWFLAAFNYMPGRDPSANRYAYAGAIFVILIVADLFSVIRIDRRALWIGAGVTLLALGPNLVQLKEGADLLKEQTVITRADTAALEIARRTVPPDFEMNPEITGSGANVIIVPSLYFQAVDAHGSPAYSAAELAVAPSTGRHWADVLLSKALPLSLSAQRTASNSRAAGKCTPLVRQGSGTSEVRARPGITEIRLAPGPPAELRARRFASEEFPVDLGSIQGGSTALLRIPSDNAPAYPWHLQLEAEQAGRICD